MASTFIKDPNATLDYAFDWRDWLATSETITTYTVTADTGLTVVSSAELNGVVTYWLSGGTGGTDYKVVSKIITNAGRTDERSVWIRVMDR